MSNYQSGRTFDAIEPTHKHTDIHTDHSHIPNIHTHSPHTHTKHTHIHSHTQTTIHIYTQQRLPQPEAIEICLGAPQPLPLNIQFNSPQCKILFSRGRHRGSEVGASYLSGLFDLYPNVIFYFASLRFICYICAHCCCESQFESFARYVHSTYLHTQCVCVRERER